MVEIDETMRDLSTLYEVIGGRDNYQLWDETAIHGRGLEEIKTELEERQNLENSEEPEKTGKHVNRQQIIDYWEILQYTGLMDQDMQLTDFGENWAERTRSAVQSLYMSNADIGDDREKIGDIFYTLGVEEVLPTIYILHEGEQLSEHLEPGAAQLSIDQMFNQGFITDEAYRNMSWDTEQDVLTDKADTVYHEIVEKDYDWLKIQNLICR